MIPYFIANQNKLLHLLAEHIEITTISLVTALLLSALITLFLYFFPLLQKTSVYILSLLYAIPSFALFALLIPLTGLGRTTAIIVLVLYAQYVLVRSFLSGAEQVDPGIIDVANGMGMNKWQTLYKIILPLAKSSIFGGIRLAANSIIAIATIAATINAGGLGDIIFEGLRTMSIIKMLWGILLVVFLSGLFNIILFLAEELFKTNRTR